MQDFMSVETSQFPSKGGHQVTCLGDHGDKFLKIFIFNRLIHVTLFWQRSNGEKVLVWPLRSSLIRSLVQKHLDLLKIIAGQLEKYTCCYKTCFLLLQVLVSTCCNPLKMSPWISYPSCCCWSSLLWNLFDTIWQHFNTYLSLILWCDKIYNDCSCFLWFW